MQIKIKLLGHLIDLNDFKEKTIIINRPMMIKELINNESIRLTDYFILVNGEKQSLDYKLRSDSLIVFAPLIEGG